MVSRKKRKMLGTLLISFLFWPKIIEASPNVENVSITDVTTRSFSVIWTTNEPATPGLEVYKYADGSGGEVGSSEAFPVQCNSALQGVAENLGVMKVRVTGLEADTTYFFKTVTDSATGQTVFPGTGEPFLEVKTAISTVRSDALNHHFSNDVIISAWTMADSQPADGTLVFASVTGGAYPVSSFVGDCAPSGSALIDLNNMFAGDSAKNFDLSQGINLNLVNFRGTDGNTQVVHEIPQDNLLAEVKSPDPGLKSGWNMASMQVEPYVNGTEDVLAPIITDMSSIWTFDATAAEWLFYDKYGLPFLNNLENIHSGAGYWIYAENPCSWKVSGDIASASQTLKAGWNLIGFNSLQSSDLPEATSAISTELNSIWTFDNSSGSWLFYDKNVPPLSNSLHIIEPGKAYWVHVSQDCTL